jgi:hypothetical protein
MTERIQGFGFNREEEPQQVPDTSHFEELKIKKTEEVELEKRRKKGKFGDEGTKTKPKEKPSPYESSFYESAEDPLPVGQELSKKVKKTKVKPEKKGAKGPGPKISEDMHSHLLQKDSKLSPLEEKEKEILLAEMAEEELESSIQGALTSKDILAKQKVIEKQKNVEIQNKTLQNVSSTLLPISQTILSNQIQAQVASSIKALSGPTIVELFHHMIGTIIVMQNKGMTSTEVILNSQNFSQSALYGAHIVIDEYSTAPYVYNIRLIGSMEAVELFNSHIGELQQAFNEHKSKLGFNVHILRTEYEKRPYFHRKEEISRDKEQSP